MNVRSIKETCLYVTDLERCRAFYEGALGLPLLSLVPGRHVFFRAGASVLLCFVAEQTEREVHLPPHGAHGVQHFAFEVARSDYDSTRSTLSAAGIPITHDHEWPNGRRSFYFSDPDGHLAEVVEEGLWE
ncbi:VOC family protein [Flaviaesturariibacter amylovorans]|uniref:VOC family protein n=1 Tax=Flaviaesturariibacter amylovorans TaxID=1084520 RepID=A0ABP8HM99_9BACT